MDIAVVVSRIGEGYFTRSPWYLYRDRLEKVGFRIHLYEDSLAGFRTRHDAIILFVSFNWLHDVNFPSDVVMPYFQHLAIYRYEYPDCINIVLHHWDMIDVPFADPLWRPGDPVLLRTPYYDRSRHYPLSNSVIGSYELDYAPKDRFKQHNEIRYMAGFIQ
jgi:hypothetical protein